MESEHRGRYTWASQLAGGRDVLDAGCGTGYGTEILASAGATRAVGVDISETAIEYARESSSREAAEFLTGNLHELPFEDDSFDMAVCFEVIEHVDDQPRAISELRRVLRPGGLLAISSPNRDVYPPGNPHHTHEFVPEELREALAREFANVRLYRQSPWLASAILDDEQSQGTGPENELTMKVVKIAAVEPGGEVFTVALASDAEPASAEALAFMGEPFEVRWWQEQLEQAQARMRELERQMVEQQKALRQEFLGAAREAATLRQTTAKAQESSSRSARRVLEVEGALAQAQAQAFALENALESQTRHASALQERVERADRVMSAMKRSISWRLTAPLRALKGRG